MALTLQLSSSRLALNGVRQRARTVTCLAQSKINVRELLLAGGASTLLLLSSASPARAEFSLNPLSAFSGKSISVKDTSLQVVNGTKKLIADSDTVAADAEALLQSGAIPEDEKKLLAQIKEAASLVSTISKDVLTQQQLRLAQEVIASSTAPAPVADVVEEVSAPAVTDAAPAVEEAAVETPVATEAPAIETSATSAEVLVAAEPAAEALVVASLEAAPVAEEAAVATP